MRGKGEPAMGFLRLMIILLALLAVIYWSLMSFLCARERERLEAEGARRTKLQDGVQAFADRVRLRLLLGVFVVPVTIFLVYVWASNR